MKWFPVELHTHSIHSDGDFTVQSLIRAARQQGYAAIALTDHNTGAGAEEMRKAAAENGIVAVDGFEWTTYWGHMVVLEENGYTDWRGVQPGEIDKALLSIHKNGGLAGIAHPFALSDPVNTGYHWAFQVQDWSLVDYMELWSRNYAPNRTQSIRAMELWENLLGKGFHITAMTGRDWHRNDGLPCCYTWIGAEDILTKENILDAVKAGRVCLTSGPLLTAEWIAGMETYAPGDTLSDPDVCIRISLDKTVMNRFWDADQIRPVQIRIIQNGTVIKSFPAEEKAECRLHLSRGWCRIDLYGTYYGTDNCRIAMTNPVWLR